MPMRIGNIYVAVQEQECPACHTAFPVNDGGRHLKGCLPYQERVAAQTSDYEDEDGVWWTYNWNRAEWERRRK